MKSRHWTWAAIPLFCLIAVPSCKMLTPLVYMSGPKQKVTAEFDKLPNHRAVVLVWADQSTLFDYPHARLELATHLSDKLSTELTQRELGAELVSPREIEEFLEKNPSARVDPARVGRQFKADYVINVEVLDFQFRSPDHPQLLQGKINASVTVYDTRIEGARGAKFALTPVNCLFPEAGAVLMNATNSLSVREATYQQFAERIARKFYDHSVEM